MYVPCTDARLFICFQYQQQQSIPQPPQGEVGSNEDAEEMDQSTTSAAEQDTSEQPADTEMTEDPSGSPIVNEVEEET